jgi:hypothetical protein
LNFHNDDTERAAALMLAQNLRPLSPCRTLIIYGYDTEKLSLTYLSSAALFQKMHDKMYASNAGVEDDLFFDAVRIICFRATDKRPFCLGFWDDCNFIYSLTLTFLDDTPHEILSPGFTRTHAATFRISTGHYYGKHFIR